MTRRAPIAPQPNSVLGTQIFRSWALIYALFRPETVTRMTQDNQVILFFRCQVIFFFQLYLELFWKFLYGMAFPEGYSVEKFPGKFWTESMQSTKPGSIEPALRVASKSIRKNPGNLLTELPCPKASLWRISWEMFEQKASQSRNLSQIKHGLTAATFRNYETLAK